MSEVLQPPRPENEPPFDVKSMNFQNLEKLHKEVTELSRVSLKLEEKAGRVTLRNVLGSVVEMSERGSGVYKLSSVSHDLIDVHCKVAPGGSYCNSPLLRDGVIGKEEAIKALREMLESIGYRIIK